MCVCPYVRETSICLTELGTGIALGLKYLRFYFYCVFFFNMVLAAHG